MPTVFMSLELCGDNAVFTHISCHLCISMYMASLADSWPDRALAQFILSRPARAARVRTAYMKGSLQIT